MIMKSTRALCIVCLCIAYGLVGCSEDPDPPASSNMTSEPTPNNTTPINSNPNPNPNTSTPLDSDGDGLSDQDELGRGTNPNLADTDGDGLSDGEEVNGNTNPVLADTDGDGVLDGTEKESGTDPTMMDASCGYLQMTASPAAKPVDIIFVVDNSFSMQEEIESVQRNINSNFADIINASGLDYRVILISKHGKSEQKNICIAAPLSGTDCMPPPSKPALTDRFYHYDTRIGSHDSLDLILSTYAEPDLQRFTTSGWREWLREDSEKIFIEVTDDAPEGTTASAVGFDAKLLELEPPLFGVPGSRRYSFHSIIGLNAKEDTQQAWQPDEGLQTNACDTAEDSALEYQKLSVLTNSVRFPVCEVASYDAVFQEVAAGIIEQSRIKCSFAFPAAPDGQIVDQNTVALELEVPGQPTRVITGLPNATGCSSEHFTIVNGSRVELCPALCDEVTALEDGKMTFFAGCAPKRCETPDNRETCGDGIDNDCNGFIDNEDPACVG